MKQSNKNGQSQSMASNSVGDKNKLQKSSTEGVKPVTKNSKEESVDNLNDSSNKEDRIQHQQKRN